MPTPKPVAASASAMPRVWAAGAKRTTGTSSHSPIRPARLTSGPKRSMRSARAPVRPADSSEAALQPPAIAAVR
jgi:hypothetical protein